MEVVFVLFKQGNCKQYIWLYKWIIFTTSIVNIIHPRERPKLNGFSSLASNPAVIGPYSPHQRLASKTIFLATVVKSKL